MLNKIIITTAAAIILVSCQVDVATFDDAAPGNSQNPTDSSTNTDSSGSNNSGNSSTGTNDQLLLKAGETLYAQQCANCHGDTGAGEPKGSSILASLSDPVSAAFTIQSTMPIQNPGLCDADCSKAIVVWLRDVNGLNPANDSGSSSDNNGSGSQDDASPTSQIILEPASKTFRRASLILTGTIPKQSQIDVLEVASDSQLRSAILNTMRGEGFKAFIKRGANDRLHVRGGNSSDIYNELNNYYTNVNDLIDQRDDEGLVDYNWSVREEPLELIAYVVMNNRPYTEILTANYTMVNDALTQLYNSGVTTNGNWKPGKNRNQSVRANSRKLEDSDREISIPHAGILTSIGLNARWQSTATNRNRARAKYVLLHFLGYDIEATASRDFPDSALEDTNNPTMNNPTCVQCHEVLDPIAGAFQNVGDIGMFFDRKGSDGADSLDSTYVSKSDIYSSNDRWYADMRAPGFYGETVSNRNQSLVWLAEHVVSDTRFAEAAVKFWWPALFGEEMFHDALTSAQRAERQNTLKWSADRFRTHQSLKELLADLIMSPWYRAERMNPVLNDADIVYYTGGTRLLTPEELSDKASSVTGIDIRQYESAFNSYFGGIDSSSSLIRAREMTSLMNKVVERVALENSCNIIATEFNRAPADRFLFKGIEASDTDSAKISSQMQVLIQRLEGRYVETHATEISKLVTLFETARQNKIDRGSHNDMVESGQFCTYQDPEKRREREWGADPEDTLYAWRVVIAALMSDFNFVYE